jgi:DNA-binding CsgD family transcriptional regulator
MLELNTSSPRLRDLTPQTLERTDPIARIQFPSVGLARKLQERLADLLRAGAAFGAVLEVPLGLEGVCLGAATWVFVDDLTCDRFRDVPIESLDDWIVNDVLRPGTVHSVSEIARLNASDGLHLFLLYFQADDAHLSDDGRLRVIQAMMADLFPRGYNLRTLTGHVRYRAQVTSGIQAGATLLRPKYLAPGPEDEVLPFPALMQAERNRISVASWIAGAFAWSRPRFNFSLAEQRSLTLALRGLSDEEIATECRISRSTVKKRWDSLLRRVVEVDRNLFDSAPADRSDHRRGREKRRVLLHYLSSHPEELTPHA